MVRILGLGDNTVDTYVDAGLQYPGGNAVNVAVMAKRLGAATAYLGCFGSDEGGALLHQALDEEGVDISRVRIRAGPNARAFIGHVNGDRQFISSTPGVRAEYTWEEEDFAYIAGFDHVHTSIYSELGDALPLIARHAASVSFDGSNRWTRDLLVEVLPHVRFAFLSGAEMDEAEALDVAQKCLALGPEAVVVTRGSEGALAVNSHGAIHQTPKAARVVDTLGAGDGFISGFLTTALAGGSLETSMAQGATFAALVCGWPGGFGHAAPWAGGAAARRADGTGEQGAEEG